MGGKEHTDSCEFLWYRPFVIGLFKNLLPRQSVYSGWLVHLIVGFGQSYLQIPRPALAHVSLCKAGIVLPEFGNLSTLLIDRQPPALRTGGLGFPFEDVHHEDLQAV